MERKASAVWQGGLKDGKGSISTNSGVLSNAEYSFGTRFENRGGTNPEELVAAAHAACFSMALSAQLEQVGLKSESITTSSSVTMEKRNEGWTVTTVELQAIAHIPGADQSKFDEAANEAKVNCPISRLLNAKIILNAQLDSKSFGEKKAG